MPLGWQCVGGGYVSILLLLDLVSEPDFIVGGSFDGYGFNPSSTGFGKRTAFA